MNTYNVKYGDQVMELTASEELDNRAIDMTKRIMSYVHTNTGIELPIYGEGSFAPLCQAIHLCKANAPEGQMDLILKPMAFYVGQYVADSTLMIWVEDQEQVPYLFGDHPDGAYIMDIVGAISEFIENGEGGNLELADAFHKVQYV